MSTNTLTPAQKAKAALAEAERLAWEQDWAEYRELEEKHRRARFNLPDPKKIPHGRPRGYTYYKCRCKECRNAWRIYMAERYRKRREANPPKPRPAPKGVNGRRVKAEMHGTLTGYTYGCRCDRCRDARKKWAKKNKTKQHGTEYVYTLGCRCKPCTQAHTEARARRRQRVEPLPLTEHGTDKGYTHYKCRCDSCRTAHNAKVKERNKNRREYYREHPEMIPDSKHGTVTGYTSYSCRCDRCKEAHRVSTANRRARNK